MMNPWLKICLMDDIAEEITNLFRSRTFSSPDDLILHYCSVISPKIRKNHPELIDTIIVSFATSEGPPGKWWVVATEVKERI
jgi:hypothetical protein